MVHLKQKRRIFVGWCIGMLVVLIAALEYLFLYVQPAITNRIISMPIVVQNQAQMRHEAYVSLSQITPYVPDAAIASQDERFYSNLGIDVGGTVRAISMSLVTGQRQGASTITEQLAKNVYFNDVDNLHTDILTKLYAVFITMRFSKQQIMTMYLNDIYFGDQAYGISAAAQTYFHTTPKQLNAAQSAYLIGLINAPSYLAKHIPQAKREGSLVLSRMYEKKYLTTEALKKSNEELSNLTIY